MRHTLCWQIVVPRLLFVVVLLLAAQYTLGRVVRRMTTGWLEAAAHKRVDLAHARVSLLRRELILNDLRIRAGREPLQSLLEIDRCELKVAVAPCSTRKPLSNAERCPACGSVRRGQQMAHRPRLDHAMLPRPSNGSTATQATRHVIGSSGWITALIRKSLASSPAWTEPTRCVLSGRNTQFISTAGLAS